MGKRRTGDETLEERLVRQILVVLLKVLLGRRDHLESNELVAALLESLDDIANQAALDAVRLDRDKAER